MMRTNHPLGKWIAVAFAMVGLIVLPGCTVKVNKGANGEEKKVDIETPVGGIHVNNGADARDTGLPVYPGAKEKSESKDGEEKNANVNISAGNFGLKVVAIEFVTDDPPDKVAAYYRDQLKHFGNILECHTSNRHGDAGNVGVHKGGDKNSSGQLSCEHDSGNTLELKVGTKQDQHIVAISSQDNGKGTDFALVFVQTHGGDRDTI